MQAETATDYEQLLRFLLHDLRTIQNSVTATATEISKAVAGKKIDKPKLKARAEDLLQTSMAFHSFLAIADFHLDPEEFVREELRRISLYKLFDWARHVMKPRARTSRVRVNLKGDGEYRVSGHRILGVVPYILLDNALKYALSDTEIDIIFASLSDIVEVEVTSLGPYSGPDELPRLQDQGVRGVHAVQATAAGTGQGLALLRSICGYHGAIVEISSSPNTQTVNGIPYSDFTATLRFQKS